MNQHPLVPIERLCAIKGLSTSQRAPTQCPGLHIQNLLTRNSETATSIGGDAEKLQNMEPETSLGCSELRPLAQEFDEDESLPEEEEESSAVFSVGFASSQDLC